MNTIFKKVFKISLILKRRLEMKKKVSSKNAQYIVFIKLYIFYYLQYDSFYIKMDAFILLSNFYGFLGFRTAMFTNQQIGLRQNFTKVLEKSESLVHFSSINLLPHCCYLSKHVEILIINFKTYTFLWNYLLVSIFLLTSV